MTTNRELQKQTAVPYSLIEVSEILDRVKALQNQKINIIFDTETTGLNARRDKMVALILRTASKVFILDVRPYYDFSEEEKNHWRSVLAEFFQHMKTITGHNLKFDWQFVYRTFGIRLNMPLIDTLLLEKVVRGCGSGMEPNFETSDEYEWETTHGYYLDEDSGKELPPNEDYELELKEDLAQKEMWEYERSQHAKEMKGVVDCNMRAVATRYGLTVSKEERSWFIGLDKPERKEEWVAPFPTEQLAYMAQDVHVPLLIHAAQQKLLREDAGLLATAELENEVLTSFAMMEDSGMCVDRELLQEFITANMKIRDDLQAGIVEQLTPHLHAHYQEELVDYLEEKAMVEREHAAWELLLAEDLSPEKEDEIKKAVQLECREKAKEGLNLSTEELKNLLRPAKTIREKVKAWKAAWYAEHPEPKVKVIPTKGRLNCLTCDINLNSHTYQLLPALQQLGLKLYDSAGKPSTGAKVLKRHKKDHPIIDSLLEWKGATKFLNTFGEKLIHRIDIDERVHSEYNQIGAKTGRTSCRTPNWQQLPAHMNIYKKAGVVLDHKIVAHAFSEEATPEEIKERETWQEINFRQCFVAGPGNLLCTADFPNIELRILAELSEDPKMLEAFARGWDLHTETAYMMFPDVLIKGKSNPKGEKFPGTTKSYRDVAKTINFGLAYGQQAAGFADLLDIPRSTAQTLIELHKQAYPQAHHYLASVGHDAIRDGYTRTVLGRKRFYAELPEKPEVPEGMSWKDFKESDLEGSDDARAYSSLYGRNFRAAMNAPIQGTSADITKRAMILLYKWLPEGVNMVAMVHDEVVCECPEHLAGLTKHIMQVALREACLLYLKRVAIPEIDVAVEKYWCK